MCNKGLNSDDFELDPEGLICEWGNGRGEAALDVTVDEHDELQYRGFYYKKKTVNSIYR